ncbi:TPA: hypothetical protein ACX6RK_003085 [Photobacterium damselae]
MKEKHLFIIWSNASYKKDEIIKDLNECFNVLSVSNIKWSKDKFAENLSRLYGQHLPNASFKQKHCGIGPFTLVIIENENPIYVDLNIGNNRGVQSVNKLVYEKKKLYRDWTGGGHKIHATNDKIEFKHDYFLLLGHHKRIDKYPIINTLETDLIGTHGWESVEQFKEALIEYEDYVILRGDINSELLRGYEDLDVMVNSKKDFSYFINSKNKGKKHSIMRHTVDVMDDKIHIDINVIGDGCFCDSWQKKMYDTKKIKDGVYRLDDENDFFMNIYHDYVHKNKEIKMGILVNYLIKNNYMVTEPKDLTVKYNVKKISQLVSSESTSLNRILFNKYSFFREIAYGIKNKIKSTQFGI